MLLRPPVVVTRYWIPTGASSVTLEAPVEIVMGTSPLGVGRPIVRSDAPLLTVILVIITSRRSTLKSPAPRSSVSATGMSDGTRTSQDREVVTNAGFGVFDRTLTAAVSPERTTRRRSPSWCVDLTASRSDAPPDRRSSPAPYPTVSDISVAP